MARNDDSLLVALGEQEEAGPGARAPGPASELSQHKQQGCCDGPRNVAQFHNFPFLFLAGRQTAFHSYCFSPSRRRSEPGRSSDLDAARKFWGGVGATGSAVLVKKLSGSS